MIKPLLCRVCKIAIPRGHGQKCILHRRQRGPKSYKQEYNARQRHKAFGLTWKD